MTKPAGVTNWVVGAPPREHQKHRPNTAQGENNRRRWCVVCCSLALLAIAPPPLATLCAMAYKRASTLVGLPDQDRGWEEVQVGRSGWVMPYTLTNLPRCVCPRLRRFANGG